MTHRNWILTRLGMAALLTTGPLYANSGDPAPIPLGIEVAVTGNDAERLMDKIMEMPGAILVENTLNTTTWQYEKIVCTLFGSHAGSPDYNNPYYQCSLGL